MTKQNFQIINIYKNFIAEEESVVEMRRADAKRSIFTAIKCIRRIEKSILKEDMDYLRTVTENISF